MKRNEIINQYLVSQRSLNMSEATIDLKKSALADFFDYLENTRVSSLLDVNYNIMLGYQSHLARSRNTHGELYNPRTQNYRISTVRSLLRYMMRNHPDYKDPTEGLDLAKAPRPLPKNILSLKEVQALLDQPDTSHPRGLRDKAILEILYSTGMRRSELIGLDLNDINHENNYILIRNAKGGRDRIAGLNRAAKSWLNKYIDEARATFIRGTSESALFLNSYGTRFGKQGVWHMVKRRAKAAGIQINISPHSIRHSIATHLTDAGCNIRYTQELLGHSTVDSTRVYITVSAQALKKAIRRHHPRGKPLKEEIILDKIKNLPMKKK